jgi:kynurenine formamidase
MCLPGTVETVQRRVEEEGLPQISRRTLLLGGAGAALAAALPATAEARRIPRKRVRDLTHVFREGSPVFSFDPPDRRPQATFAEHGFYSQRWTFHEHSGTHMDAPGHFVPAGRRTPQITPRELIIPVVVIDISAKAARDPNAMVTPDDLIRFERRHGRIPRGALIAMDSGWAAKINNPLAFKGGVAFPGYNFPGFSIEAAEWLLARRRPAAIGVDTMSLDPGNSTTFPVHFGWLGADRYGIENLNNLGKIPPRGATAVIGVVPWEEGSGGPLRALAIW